MMKRVDRFLEALKATDRQAALIHNPANIFYLSGYTGEGCLFVSGKGRALITDFRYTEQAEKQAPGFDVHMTDKDNTPQGVVAALCAQWGVEAVFHEDDTMTVREFGKYREAIPAAEWCVVGDCLEELRQVKDEDELALIRKACQITGEAFERLLPQIKEGMTEKELAALLEYDMRSHGADGIAFSSIVAAGANGSLPHAVPSDAKLKKGDMITLDFGAKAGGYCADMTRTVALGEPSQEMKRVYQVVQEAQRLAQEAVAAGKSCKAVDAIARDYINSQGYEGRFGHGLGHSLGIEIHENPRFNTQSEAILQEGQLMTVEPGVYLPGIGGVRIENTVVVTKDGCIALTTPTRDLIIL
ncbi:MAG: Xaa-Pro peptidase family protein [Candidatus Limiplasma sp.]|nr:Xaa-Pro peptidase family protein [Candidatus Limiplasma sp.]